MACNPTKRLKNSSYELHILKVIYSGQGNFLRPVGLPQFFRFLVLRMIRLVIMDESTGLEWRRQIMDRVMLLNHKIHA